MLSLRSGVEPLNPSIISAASNLYRFQMSCQFALAMVIFYDAILTFDKEIKYFWNAPWKPISAIYFLNRYIGLFSALAALWSYTSTANQRLCNFSMWATEIGDWMIILLIDYILCLRILALYSQDRNLMIVLGTLFISESAIILGSIVNSMIKENVNVEGLGNFLVCGFELQAPHEQFGTLAWSAPLLFEIILMILGLYKATKLWQTSIRFRDFSLVRVMAQDQIIYFALIVACGITRIVSYWVVLNGAGVIDLVFALLSPTFLCVVGSRLMVHLKEASEGGRPERDTSCVVRVEMSTIKSVI